MLRAGGTDPACSRRADAGTGARGVALSTREVRRQERTALPDEDGAEAPSADDGIGDSRHRGTELLAAAEGDVVDHRGVPAVSAGSFYVAEVGSTVEDGGRSRAAALTRKASVVRALVIGERLGVGPGGVEGKAVLEAVAQLDLKRVVAFVRTCGASVDGSPVGEQACAEWLVERRDGRREGQGVLIGSPDELVRL